MIYRLIIFLILNFGALAIGGLYTGTGVMSDWYIGLNKAPWTPPGWVFGAAWTTIMICFSIYMARLWPVAKDTKLLLVLYSMQWVLNVSWNPTFFHFHKVLIALVVIVSLSLLITYIILCYWRKLKRESLLLVPYFIWLLIATSLNGYIYFNN